MNFFSKLKQRVKLNKARAQNQAFAKKYGDKPKEKSIPLLFTGALHPRKIVKEIKGTLTGKIVAYEDENGFWIEAGTDHHIKQGNRLITIKSPATEEFEAGQTLSYPYTPSCGSPASTTQP